ncbi:MAG: HAD-IA family hydrolase [Acidobacteriota bacterium]
MTYRLLVFDWDGTVMDSVGTIVTCAEATLETLGLESPPEDHLRGAIGLGLRETVEHLQPGCDEATAERIVETYRELWLSTYRFHPSPFPAAEAVLTELAERDYLLAVATGKSRRGLDRDLAATGFERFFHASRTPDESHTKPHPHMLLELLDELGATAGETLMIGDSRWDLEMARSAGTEALGVTSGSEPEASLKRFAPVACLAGIGDLPEWLSEVSR